ncbi:MAG: hypothetical protein ACPGJS_16800 [Flammeovirgaceae bacterium]
MSAVQETSVAEEVTTIVQRVDDTAIPLVEQLQDLKTEIVNQGLMLPVEANQTGILSGNSINQVFMPVIEVIQEASTHSQSEHDVLTKAKQTFIDITYQYPIYSQSQETLSASKTILEANSLNSFLTTTNQFVEGIASTNNQLFEQALIQSVQKASIQVGFNTITDVSKHSNYTHIVSKAANGQLFVSDIMIENGKYTILSETIGIYDQTCQQILDDFEDKLEVLGVKCKRKSRKDSSRIKNTKPVAGSKKKSQTSKKTTKHIQPRSPNQLGTFIHQ